jgi:tyrosine-protein phosphatase 2/3
MLASNFKCSPSFQASEQRIEQEWLDLVQSPSTKSGNAELYYNVALQHPSKNRYPDVLPFESTRVRLNSGEYINANYISLSPNARYICAQAPLPNTFTEFWQMVWVGLAAF